MQVPGDDTLEIKIRIGIQGDAVIMKLPHAKQKIMHDHAKQGHGDQKDLPVNLTWPDPFRHATIISWLGNRGSWIFHSFSSSRISTSCWQRRRYLFEIFSITSAQSSAQF